MTRPTRRKLVKRLRCTYADGDAVGDQMAVDIPFTDLCMVSQLVDMPEFYRNRFCMVMDCSA